MGRIAELFRRKQHRVLSLYCTAGFPRLEDTLPVLRALADCGADIVELGMPYSDPLADGPVIQRSSTIALQNGMTIEKLFDQLQDLRAASSRFGVPDLPILLMGYMNPILQYGFEKFCAAAAKVGIDGLILPDLPSYEYETEYSAIIRKYRLDFVFLVTPETSAERVRKLDKLSSGFLYAVSSSSTTGRDKNMQQVATYIRKITSLGLQNPVLVGFGIKDKETFEKACEVANGAVIGTAFIQALDKNHDVFRATKEFLAGITSS